jgi:ATP-dependent exoDNAse (exonuclease V) beta subunit
VIAPDLNEGQRAAVAAAARRIVISAGAGSGKTLVLAVRFADAVFAQEARGQSSPITSVLLITFTEKAAGELVERVRRVFLDRGRPDLAREVDGAWISTIHGFCSRIVRRHALELGVDPAFGVLADPQVGVVRREAFERAATGLLGDPGVARLMETRGPERLRTTTRSAYDRVRSMGRDVDEVVPCAPPDLAPALRDLVPTLRETLGAYGALEANKTIAENASRFAAAARVAERLAASGPDMQTAREAGTLYASYRGAMRGRQETTDLTGAANAALLRAAQAAVDTLAAADAAAWLALLKVYARVYEEAKSTLGVLDFEDLQLLTRRLWCERPHAAGRYAEQFSQVMIDEFQDTNALQFEAIEPVAGRALCVVGDVQQSIYRFRDADVGLFVGQKRSAEADTDADECRLTVNYRSHVELLATFNALFSTPGFFGPDYLHLEDAGDRPTDVRWPADEPRVEVIVVDKAGWEGNGWREAEARALAGRVRELVDDGRVAPEDVVVLARAMTTARPFVEALRAVGFAVHAAETGGYYSTPEVADARALLRVLTNPLDSEGVLGLLAGGLGGLSDDALYRLAASRPDGDLWAALPGAADLGLGERDVGRARIVHETVETLRARQGRMRLADAILHAVSVLGPCGGCLARHGAQANLRKTVRLAAEFETVTPADPAAFLRYLDDRETYVRRESPVGTPAEGAGVIRVMSIHAAKGLEFPVVVLADLGHGSPRNSEELAVVREGDSLTAAVDVARQLPKDSPKASVWARAEQEEGRLDLEESKRVFYVACTRAEQALLLTGSAHLDKAPGDGTDMDRLRAAITDAGPGGVPGLKVTEVTASAAEGSSAPAEPKFGARPADDAGIAVPATILLSAPAIAAPAETSYTALDLYERCGYRFFAERMLGIGSVDVVRGDDPRALGSALHGALQTLAEGRAVDEERLASLAAAHRLSAEGVARLRGAIDALLGSPAGALLERGRAEVPFAVRVDGGIVAGSMDLVVRDGDVATVLDYKTGSSSVADESRNRAQAEIYALALLVAGCTTATVRFVRVEAGCEETEITFDAGDRGRIAARVEGAFAAMGRGEFARRRAFDASVCPDCPVSGSLCPVVHPGGKAARAR